MKTEPLGDSALILRDFEVPAYQLADSIRAAHLPGVTETVASYETVGVYFDPEVFEPSSLGNLQINLTNPSSITHEIPVCYELGEDLDSVADHLGVAGSEVIRLHSAQVYRCFAVGFCPGFPYLGYLPSELASIPRRPAPRIRVSPGSVAITGRQTGIYPLERPGGWAILGRTPLCIVDPENGYFPIRAGDEVRFLPIGPNQFDALKGSRL